MKVSKFVRLLGIVLVLALAVGVVSAQDDGEKVLRTGIAMVGGDLNTIDPAVSEVSGENQIIAEIFVGLTRQNDETGEVVGGMAESWEFSEDGLTITYNLLQGVPWVRVNPDSGEVEQVMDDSGNPRLVTAQDFVYGWRRTLAPETASPYASILSAYVTNGVEYVAGEAAAEDLGIVAIDDYTLEVTQPEPVGFAYAVHGLWMANAQPQWAIEAGGDEWTEPEFINTYGPFALAEWNHDVGITLVKNPFWPGIESAPQPQIDRIEFMFLDPLTQYNEYLAGNIDAIDVPLEQVDAIRADPVLSQEYHANTRPCTYYIGFDNTEAPTNNVHLRRALSMAIDRQSIVENVTRRGETPAAWFTRPGLNAAPSPETNPDLGVQFDVEAAQAELAIALEDLGLSAPDELPLTFTFNTGSGHEAIVQALQQMWADNLGVNVTIVGMDPTPYFTQMSLDAPPLFRSGWCQDYPDANNFAYDVFHSTSTQNDTGYASEAYDAIVEQARLETDVEARRELYAQSEDILVNQDAGVAPLYWYVFVSLSKPNVIRTESVIGRQHYEKWDIQ